MKTRLKNKRGFTLTEIMIVVTISGLVLAGVISSFLLFSRSTLRLTDYMNMETEATRALEFLARDLRMAQSIKSEKSGGEIRKITLKVPDKTGVTQDVVYQFTAADTFDRKAGASANRVLVRDIEPGSGSFAAYNLNAATAANDYETNQIKVLMTVRPKTHGNYADTTKRVLSARFVLRNR